jgi:hypothetical protein
VGSPAQPFAQTQESVQGQKHFAKSNRYVLTFFIVQGHIVSTARCFKLATKWDNDLIAIPTYDVIWAVSL